MKRTAFVLLVSCFSFAAFASAQELPPLLAALEGRYTPATVPEITYRGPDGRHVSGQRCDTPEPTLAERRRIEARLEASARLFGEPEAKTTVIPVAFHVVHKGGASNVPDAMLEAQIDVLNDAFRSHRYSFFIDSIDRTKKSSWFRKCGDFGSNYIKMTDRLSIDPAHTLNIYLCQPGDGVLGFAFFPSSFPEDDTLHGVTVLYSTLPGGDATPFDLGGTIVHEVGHYLGLYHTFQDGCADGDEVADTPAQDSPSSGCPIGRDSCIGGGPDPVTNFMDYSDDACYEEFTRGQRKRMDREVRTFRPSLGT